MLRQEGSPHGQNNYRYRLILLFLGQIRNSIIVVSDWSG